MNDKTTRVVAAEWKALGDGTGQLEAYGMAYNNIDLQGDVALPHCAAKTLADRAASGRPFPLIADHQLDSSGVVGSVTSAVEDDRGVRIRAAFASTAKAQELRTLVLEGHVGGLSVTYEALQSYRGTFQGQSVRFLKEVRIHEFSLTPFPANTSARVLAAKAGGQVPRDPDDDWPAERVAELEERLRVMALEESRDALASMARNPAAAKHALDVIERDQTDRLEQRLLAAAPAMAAEVERLIREGDRRRAALPAWAKSEADYQRAVESSYAMAEYRRRREQATPCGWCPSCRIGRTQHCERTT